MTNYPIGTQLVFQSEPESPYTVMASSAAYLIATRQLEDRDAETFELSFEEFERYKDDGEVVYCIVDFRNRVRGKDHWVFGRYKYKTLDGCRQCINEMESGVCQISRRNSEPLSIIKVIDPKDDGR